MRQPLVTVLTPVYNDGRYLRECIESVRAQTYGHWEYVIVDNRSTDDGPAIAREYAALDRRIRLVVNDEHVGVIRNHNIAFRCVSAGSAYCKVVQADDWMFPQCLEAMVGLAEARSSVDLVSAYRLNGAWVDLDGLVSAGRLRGPSLEANGLPWLTSVVPGPEVCRLSLLGAPYVFGTPTSILIRSDVVRGRDPFFDESSLHSDKAACFEVLRDADFGFVHQVLTFTRPHDEDGTVTALSQRFNTYLAGNLAILTKYGPRCLEADEYHRCLHEQLDRYYTFLARRLAARASPEFWAFHRAALAAAGHPLRRTRLLRALVVELAHLPLRLERGFSALARWRREHQPAFREDEIERIVRRMQAQRMTKDATAREATARMRIAAAPERLTSTSTGA